MSDDPIRRRTRDLAAGLGRPALGGPPPRPPRPPAPELEEQAVSPAPTAAPADSDERPEDGASARGEAPAGESPADADAPKVATLTEARAPVDVGGADGPGTTRSNATGPGAHPRPKATGTARSPDRAAGPGPAAPMSVTLTTQAGDLLNDARREGATAREVVLGAVQTSARELRRRHPPLVDPTGPIPITPTPRRRRLDNYGVKIPLRLYAPERAALDDLAGELGLTLSALVTEAIELRYGPQVT